MTYDHQSKFAGIYYLLCIILLLVSCNEEHVNRKNIEILAKNAGSEAIRIYPDSANSIFFSGFKWIAVDSKLDYDLQHFCESDPRNCYLDNMLTLTISGEGINRRGVILELDTILGYGVYSFDIISNISDLKEIAEFTISLINAQKSSLESVSEIGIRFSYMDTVSSPLSYYIYTTTDRLPYEFFHEGRYPSLELTKHLIEIDHSFIRLVSFEGFLDYQTTEFFEYIFEFSDEDIDLEIPNQVRIKLSLCLKPELMDNDLDDIKIELLRISYTDSESYYSRY
jgi:hypothetical protein